MGVIDANLSRYVQDHPEPAPKYPCSICKKDMGWDAPSGVCSSECLSRGQGFSQETTNEETGTHEDPVRLVTLEPAGWDSPSEPMTPIDRFTTGLITWEQLIEECLESERQESESLAMTERERTAKVAELDTLIAFLTEELEVIRARSSEGYLFRLGSLVRLRAKRHLIALAS